MAPAEHILIVDDDSGIRQLVGDYLHKNAYRTTAVGESKAANALPAEACVALGVLDVMLPGEDGLTLCRNLRALGYSHHYLAARGEKDRSHRQARNGR